MQPRVDEVERVIQSWDTAQTKEGKGRGSYSVMVEGLKLKNGEIFINQVYRERKSPAELTHDMTRLFMEAEATFGKNKVRIIVENKASGPALVSFLKSYSAIGPYIKVWDIPGNIHGRGQGDLVQRAAAVSHIFETHTVRLPADDTWRPWKEDYIQELSAFPEVTFRDQVAATVLLLEYAFPTTYIGAPPMIPVYIPGWTH